MKKFLLVCTAFIILFTSSVSAQPVTFNFSVTLEIDDFKDCENAECRLLARIWEHNSNDVKSYFDSLAANNSSNENFEDNKINVNVTVSHSYSWIGTAKNWVLSFFSPSTTSEETKSEFKSASRDSQSEKKADLVKLENHENAKKIADEILKFINVSDDLYCLELVRESSQREIIFGNSDLSELNFYDEGTNFLDSEKLLNRLREICSDDLVVRSNKRFNCASSSDLSDEDLETLLKNIADDSIFNSEKLKIQSGDLGLFSSLREKLTSLFENNKCDIAGTFRFFFKTNRENVYVLKTLSYPEKKFNSYVAIKNAEVVKRSLEGELKKSLSLLYSDLDFWLIKSSSKLGNPDITLDDCLKIFVDDVRDRVVVAKINKTDIEELKAQINEAWLREFLEKGALEKVDSISDINNSEYFIEDNLTFCRAFPSSTGNYSFVDKNKFDEILRSLYDSKLSKRGLSSFSFRCSEVWRPDANSILLSIKSLKPIQAEDTEKIYSDNGFTRLFFKTNLKNVYLVAILQSHETRFYIASRQSVFSKDKLNDLLNDEKIINYDDNEALITFNLWTPDNRLQNGDIDKCVDIFINQFLQHAEIFDTAR